MRERRENSCKNGKRGKRERRKEEKRRRRKQRAKSSNCTVRLDGKTTQKRVRSARSLSSNATRNRNWATVAAATAALESPPLWTLVKTVLLPSLVFHLSTNLPTISPSFSPNHVTHSIVPSPTYLILAAFLSTYSFYMNVSCDVSSKVPTIRRSCSTFRHLFSLNVWIVIYHPIFFLLRSFISIPPIFTHVNISNYLL